MVNMYYKWDVYKRQQLFIINYSLSIYHFLFPSPQYLPFPSEMCIRARDKTTQPGDYKFVDLNGDGQITDADRTVIGNGYPKFTYGMNLTASWKNFDFSRCV